MIKFAKKKGKEEDQEDENDEKVLKRTRPDTRLPQSRAGGQGP